MPKCCPVAPKTLLIEVDSREKRGHDLLFPAHLTYTWGGHIRSVALETERKILQEGDYRCPRVGRALGFERKGSLRELNTNFLTADRDRARAAFIRFADAFDTPVVLAHVSYREFRPNLRVGSLILPGHRVWDSFVRLCLELGLHLWVVGACRTVGDRRQLGSMVARTFLQWSLTHAN